jgi:hypothetical protein
VVFSLGSVPRVSLGSFPRVYFFDCLLAVFQKRIMIGGAGPAESMAGVWQLCESEMATKDTHLVL